MQKYTPEDEREDEELPGFRDTQELIAQVNRELEEQEERELAALDDAIVGTNRDELRSLRAQLEQGKRS